MKETIYQTKPKPATAFNSLPSFADSAVETTKEMRETSEDYVSALIDASKKAIQEKD